MAAVSSEWYVVPTADDDMNSISTTDADADADAQTLTRDMEALAVVVAPWAPPPSTRVPVVITMYEGGVFERRPLHVRARDGPLEIWTALHRRRIDHRFCTVMLGGVLVVQLPPDATVATLAIPDDEGVHKLHIHVEDTRGMHPMRGQQTRLARPLIDALENVIDEDRNAFPEMRKPLWTALQSLFSVDPPELPAQAALVDPRLG